MLFGNICPLPITPIHYAQFVVFNKKFNPFGYDGNLSGRWKNLLDYRWRSMYRGIAEGMPITLCRFLYSHDYVTFIYAFAFVFH